MTTRTNYIPGILERLKEAEIKIPDEFRISRDPSLRVGSKRGIFAHAGLKPSTKQGFHRWLLRIRVNLLRSRADIDLAKKIWPEGGAEIEKAIFESIR